MVWAEVSLATINRLISTNQIQRVPGVNPARGISLLDFINAFETAKNSPFDQSAHERLWVLGERASSFLNDEEKLFLLPWIPPFANTIPEMAFCRVADGWKDYVKQKTGLPYGELTRNRQSPPHRTCDECLNALRNLLVHGSGFLEADERGSRRHEKFVRLLPQAAAHNSSHNALLKIPSRIVSLADGDVVMLNSSEVIDYIEGVKEMFVALES